jgi:Tol biopolymer transport system component
MTMGMRIFTLVQLWLFANLACLAAEAPEKLRLEPSFLSNTRQLTLEGRRSGEGYFSPDGKQLIFQSEREPGNPFYQIYMLDLESGDTHRVSPGIGKTTCAFFRPESEQVLFSSTHLDPNAKQKQKTELEFRASGKERRYSWDYDEQMEIFSAKRDGTQLRNLTHSLGYDAEGAWSPDGKKIIFCSLRNAYPTNKLSAEDQKRFGTDPAYFGEIYIMNADGSNQRRLTDWPGYDGGPFFSPDGQRIIWRHFDENGVIADVYTMKQDGSDVQRLTAFGSMSWAPSYHPSGKYVIFTSNKLGFSNFELFLVDAAGQREPVRVTDTDGFDGLPVFSPDGRKLCWTSSRTADGKSQLFMADWNNQAALQALEAAPLRASGQTSPLAARNLPPEPGSQLSPEVKDSDLRLEVGYLASDALEGRMSGSAGSAKAASFISNYLKKIGLKPTGTSEGYGQQFEFTSGVKVVSNRNELRISSPDNAPHVFTVGQDFNPLSFTDNGEAQGSVVFAGYGLVVPGKPGNGYNSYQGLDVSNKIVLVLRYVPEDVEPKRRQELNRYAGLRYKALMARERGAKAILVAAGPKSPNAGELIDMSFDSSMAGSGIIAASVGSNVVQSLLASSGKDLKTLQTGLDNENPHAEGSLELTNTTVKIATGVDFIKKTDQNILGYLPPAGSSHEYVVVGAHYDHLGYGEVGAFERKGEEHQIHSGADDNASGVAAVMEIAGSLAEAREKHPEDFQRGVLFAFWSGEEIGLIGSSRFVEHPVLPLSNAVAYLNFDMVGRLRENKLTLQGIGSSSVWRKLIEKRNILAGFNLVLQDDPYLPTDTTSFYPKHVPVLSFFTGSHEDYHRPTDKPGTLNYEGMEKISRMARGLVLDLAKAPERPDYLKVTHMEIVGARETLRAYLGSIPDYTAEVTGVKLSGVRGGSPADKAGLKGGDILVEFGGQKVANIYDYTYALDAAKIGHPVAIAILRDGKLLNLTVTPEARK